MLHLADRKTANGNDLMIFNLFKRKAQKREEIADELYRQIVAAARQPEFYLSYAVEDSVTGRFEMIVLHAYVFFYRMKSETAKDRELSQAVFGRFFQDMDDSLREQGVGDLSVPKKIKKMAQSFYGHVEAYDQAREQGGEALAIALSRNIYGEENTVCPEAAGLARYILLCEEKLKLQTVEDFSKGELHFPEVGPFQAD
nr:ubiquinol-cytochrome C chaperone family protein [uncultured Cohaesibacter sp.]